MTCGDQLLLATPHNDNGRRVGVAVMVLEFSVGALDLFLLAYSAFLPQPFIYFIRCICCYTICVFLFDCFQSQKLLFELGVPGVPRGRRLPDKSTLSAFSTIVSLRNQRLNYYKLTSRSGPACWIGFHVRSKSCSMHASDRSAQKPQNLYMNNLIAADMLFFLN